MKKLSTLLLIAFAMVLGLTQCKKKVDTIATPSDLGEAVHITVNVDDGGKHIVYPGTGAYVFENGDKLYVGNGSKYLGTLTYGSGAFSGDITEPAVGDYLYFYFLGGLELASPSAGTTSYTVSIADQSSKLPVLSFGRSTSTYTTSTATYGCTLLNKCALVKFTLATATPNTVTVGGMKTTATINFATPGITPTATTGEVTLYSESTTAKWAILLPQDAVDDATVTIGSADYTADVPAIAANDYVTSGIEIDNAYVFSVSGSKTVHFSPGNLQYKSGEGWRFAEHQYDVIGSWNTSDWVDLFGWGTWGSGKNPLNTSSDYDDYQWSTDFKETLDGHDDWRTPTKDEWVYVFNTRSTTSGVKYAKATVNGVKGVILLPDNWSTSYYTLTSTNTPDAAYASNEITLSDWNTLLEANGAVFLPAAGCRYGTGVLDVGDFGYYWSSSAGGEYVAWGVYFDYYDVCPDNYYYYRYFGQSVRLVR